jgi:alpha-tubulin suppressor-like RCC1 family protein
MPTTGFTDNDGIDVGNKYVTKDYVMNFYPDIAPNMKTPQLLVCGNNALGGLGDNSSTNKSSPVTVSGGGTNWQQVACTSINGMGIKTDGTLWTWGANAVGQLGDGSTTSRSSPGTTAGGGTTWKQVAGGLGSTANSGSIAAVKTDGTLWTWGHNNSGQLGNGGLTSRTSPGTTAGGGTNWKQVSCCTSVNAFMAAVKTDGTLWTWGDGTAGVLGDGTVTAKQSPVTTSGGGTNWKQVSCGDQHSAAVKTDGTLWAWGLATSFRLGDGTIVGKSSPVTTILGGTTWKQVSCGGSHTAAIKTDGTLWAWGNNASGQIGIGTATGTAASPVTTIGGGTNWRQVALGGSSSYAIKTDGTLWIWGINTEGQLATGNTSTISSPTTTTMGGTNWKSVAPSYNLFAISEAEGW